MADITGAPAANAGVAPAAGADATTDPPLSHEQLQDEIRSLPPQEAAELLAEYSRIYHAPAPAALTPQTPREADARLQQLISDPAWTGKLLNGHYDVVQEFHALNALKATGDIGDAMAGGEALVETTVGPGLDGSKLTRRDAIGAAADLRAQGASDDEIQLILNDQPYPADVVADARRWLPAMERDPLLRVPLPGYDQVDRERLMGFFRRALAIGDGSGPF
jgi:hypothetical protein